MSFIQIYEILTSYIYLYVILLSKRDKIKGYRPTLKIEFFSIPVFTENIFMT